MSSCKYLDYFYSSPDSLDRTSPKQSITISTLWALFWTQYESVLLCLSRIVCSTEWSNGSVTHLPGSSHLKVGRGSCPKEALGHDVVRRAELSSPKHGVSGAGRFPVPSESAHVPICSTPVEKAQTKSASSFEGHETVPLHKQWLVHGCVCQFCSLQCRSALLTYPCRSADLFAQYCITHLYKVCRALPAVPLAPAGLCSVLSQEGRVREPGAKL